MGYSRRYTYWADNADREEFYNESGKLETTHVDRYNLDGSYKSTDVYNSRDQKIDTFIK